MPFRRPLCLAAAIMASTVAGCTAVSVALAPTPVTLATGTPGGVYHPVGSAICRMFDLGDKHQAMPCVAVSSDGSVANIRRVESGDANFGLSQTDVAYAAFHGEGPFAAAGPDPKLRTLIALYPEAFTVVARPDTGIRDFQDLRGKRVGIGTSGVGYNFTYDVVLGFYGSTTSSPERVLELPPAEQNQALCENKVDAIIFEAGHPNGLTQEATTDCRARLVRVAGPPIDRLLATHSDYVAYVIPGGMYPGNPDDVPTIGTQAVLVASSNQPDELCYALVKAVIENFADFRRLHPALSTLEIKDMVPSGVCHTDPSGLTEYQFNPGGHQRDGQKQSGEDQRGGQLEWIGGRDPQPSTFCMSRDGPPITLRTSGLGIIKAPRCHRGSTSDLNLSRRPSVRLNLNQPGPSGKIPNCRYVVQRCLVFAIGGLKRHGRGEPWLLRDGLLPCRWTRTSIWHWSRFLDRARSR